MYIQVRQPLGAIITVDGESFKIPFTVKANKTKKDLWKKELEKINADYTITGGRVFPAKKVVPKETPKKIEENSDDKSKTKKSDRKNSKN